MTTQGRLPSKAEELVRQHGTVSLDTLLDTLNLTNAELTQGPGSPTADLDETPLPRAAVGRLRDLANILILGAPWSGVHRLNISLVLRTAPAVVCQPDCR